MAVMRPSLSLAAPMIDDEDVAAVTNVLRSGRLSIGPMTDAFEQAVAARAGVSHGIAVSSGTAGLHLAMIAAGARRGVQVVTSPFSFAASVNCFLYEGAVPVFADIDPVSLDLDPRSVEEALADATRATILLPVHIFGQPCDMDPLLRIARSRGLVVVEDACEAIAAEYKGRAVGGFGQSAVFAFYPNKQITTGEGGVIVTNDDSLARLFRSLRNQGRGESGAWLDHVRLGYNYRLDEMSAALGWSQLRRLDARLRGRADVADRYARALASVDGVAIPRIASTTTRVSWFLYVIVLAEGVDRTRVMARLEVEGVPTRPYFRPLHQQPYFVERFGDLTGRYPVTERVGARSLALPFHERLSTEDVEYVADRLARAISSAS